MKTFDRTDYDNFMKLLQGMNIKRLDESYHQSEGNIVNIRHDVDADIHSSFMMAQIESELGIKSTYFILDTAPYWPREVWKYVELISRFGHEIGWHNNSITKHLQSGEPIKKCILEPLSILRQYAQVVGSASHGDLLCHEKKYLNYYCFYKDPHPAFENIDIVEKVDMDEFGLMYEAYHTGSTHYISDAGGKWNHHPCAYIKKFINEGGKLQINIHPQWWKL